MTLERQRYVEARDRRIENLIAFCKQKYTEDYTPKLFDIFYAGYDLARRRVIQGKEL